MLVPLCNCDHHFTLFPTETLLSHTFRSRSAPFKPLRRRAFISAAASGEALPQSAVSRIAEKLRSLGYIEDSKDGAVQRFHELGRGVLEERERFREHDQGKGKSDPSLAEVKLPEKELRRLRSIGIGLREMLKLGKAGITEGIVNGIHERWRQSELVKIRCEDICRLNMKMTHELLEKKTGGLVIWRSGSNILLYRGSNYKYPYFLTDKLASHSSSEESAYTDKDQRITLESTVLNPDTRISHPPIIKELAEEADAMLEGLGPRFTDWWGYDPLPVDADLLPGVVPGHKRPFRLLPYGVKYNLTNDEMTTLKRLGRPLPCHFALGRNRKHQGLAAAIVKLWEKCEIAKIAIKRGVQNTNSELMAEEIKWLTGGTLLSRDKEFIVFYRGKDFLPASFSSAIEERRKNISESWIVNSSILNLNDKKHETKQYDAGVEHEDENDQNLSGHSEESRRGFSRTAVKITTDKLSEKGLEKKVKAEKLLEELEKSETPQRPETDKESITEEERQMLRKVGLRMKPFLLLGRRGVFDGTVENMHLHWKYRELVKVCFGRRTDEEVHRIARTLEAESGGILVAVEQFSKGNAIIVYRGKNYTRPASLRPQTLLSKRAALKCSIEAQRRQALKLHVLPSNGNIDELQLKMVEQEVIENHHDDDKTYLKDPAPTKADLQLELLPEETRNELNDRLSSYQRSRYRVNSSTTEFEPSVENANDERLSVTPARPFQLSNKERLLLRKQALSMKKIPLLAVGKSNAITGLANAIKDHFRKHPLAIVGIKGRAKGTSVQEVIYNLEQATGAVFVSREPTKVILYRGWGFKADPDQASGKMSINQSAGGDVKARRVISPELKSAMRLECGLKSAKVETDL